LYEDVKFNKPIKVKRKFFNCVNKKLAQEGALFKELSVF
jgi:hypothetical protein